MAGGACISRRGGVGDALLRSLEPEPRPFVGEADEEEGVGVTVELVFELVELF